MRILACSWVFIMAGTFLGEILGVTGNSFGDFVSETFLNDDGQILYEGRTIVYKSSPRSLRFPVVYEGKATDQSSGISVTTAETEHYDDPHDASQKAVAKLLAILRERGLINDQMPKTNPDSVSPKSVPAEPDPTVVEPTTIPTQKPIIQETEDPKPSSGLQQEPDDSDSNPDRGTPPSLPEQTSTQTSEQRAHNEEPNWEAEPEPKTELNRSPVMDPAPGFKYNKDDDEKQGPLPDIDEASSHQTGSGHEQDQNLLDQLGWTSRTVLALFIAFCVASFSGFLLELCEFSSMVETIFRFIGFITIGWVFLFLDTFYVNRILSKAVQRITKIIHKLSTSFSNLRGVVQPFGTILEVVPDYKGSYADYTMKKAHPTADMLSPKFNYQLTSPCKGIAFILNNFEFDGNERSGSQIDLDNMVHLFQEIGYMNMIHENLTANGIRDSVRSFASMFNGDTYDSAVIVLMSHGNTGVILGTDLAQVNLRDLEREFEGDNCPGLNGKPKMFFVQACRGDLPLRIPVVADRPYPKAHTGGYDDLETLHVVPDNEFARNNDDVADVHIAFATTEGHLSLRSEVIGSFFVQALCEVFFANAHQDNLDTLMNKVAYRVDRMKGKLYNHTSGKWISVKQTPECLKRGMRKSLYFLPNYSKSK